MQMFDDITTNAGQATTQIHEQIERLARIRRRLPDHTSTTHQAAEQAALDYIRALADLRDSSDQAIKAVAQELAARRVPLGQIADAAQVTRQTVSRWKQSQDSDAKQHQPSDGPGTYDASGPTVVLVNDEVAASPTRQ